MIVSLIDNEKALNLLSNNDVEWPLLSDDEWISFAPFWSNLSS